MIEKLHEALDAARAEGREDIAIYIEEVIRRALEDTPIVGPGEGD